jgi:pimeloyl-ACP methyl ester carboxylesterase
MPGFGASEPLDEPTLSANARLLKDLLHARKADRAVVVGNSFGAAVAIQFAASYPERTRHLVLVNGGYVPFLPGFMKKLISTPAVEKRFRSIMRGVAYSDKALAKAFPDPSKLPPAFFDRIHQSEEKHSRIVFDTFMKQTKPQTPPGVPATIIWGTGDRLTTMKQAGTLRKWLGNADFVAVNGAGHMPQIEQPGEFVEAVKKAGGCNESQVASYHGSSFSP